MKQKLCLLGILLGTFFITGQAQQNQTPQDINCYNEYLRKGKTALARGNYSQAINDYIYARFCPGSVNDGEIERLIDATLGRWVDSLHRANDKIAGLLEETEKEKNKAESEKERAEQEREIAQKAQAEAARQRDTAEFNSRLFYSYFTANEAIQDLDHLALEKGLRKAFHARDTLEKTGTPIPPTVHQALGLAVFKNYGKRMLLTHQDGIIDLEFSKDGKTLLVVGRDGKISLWDYTGQDLILRKDLPKSSDSGKSTKRNRTDEKNTMILTAAFDSSAERLAYGEKGPIAEITDPDGTTSFSLRGKHEAAIIAVKFLANGNLLTAGRDGKVIMWDEKGKFLSLLINDGNPIIELTLSENEQYVLARTMKSVYYWDADQLLNLPLEPLFKSLGNQLVYTASLSPDGNWVAVSESSPNVKMWYRGEENVGVPHLNGPVFNLTFSADSKHLLVGSKEGIVQSWNNVGAIWGIDELYLFNPSLIDQLKVNRSATHYAAAGLDRMLYFFNTERTLSKSLQNGRITHISFSEKNDSLLLTSSSRGTVKLWRINGQFLMNMDLGSPVMKSVFSQDGNYLISGTDNGSIYFTPTADYIFNILKQRENELEFRAIKNELKENIERLLLGK